LLIGFSHADANELQKKGPWNGKTVCADVAQTVLVLLAAFSTCCGLFNGECRGRQLMFS